MIREIRETPDIELLAQQWGTGKTDEPTERPKVQSVTEIASIRTYAAQRIEWLVETFIAAGTVNLITGESGGGKSTVVSAISSCIERGVPFAGLTTQRRPVLTLDRENPLSVVCERFDRLGINDGPNFIMWGGWAAEEAPAPWSPIVIRWVEACEPKPLIVVDSLVSFHGGDENSATETRSYMQGFRRLADLGATVLVLHHSGKGDSSKDYRGSSDIKASVDVAYSLANLGDSARLGTLRLRAFKARFSVQPELILQYNDGGFRMDSRGPMLTVTDTLRQLLIANPRIGVVEFEDLAIQKGIGRSNARKFITNGSQPRGSIRVDKGPHNSRFHSWVGGDLVNDFEDAA
jgi:archaellum biogenesis ATPase FlaH